MVSIGASLWRLLHPWELVWRPNFQQRLGFSKNGHGCHSGLELVLGLHEEYHKVVKLIMELHHMT